MVAATIMPLASESASSIGVFLFCFRFRPFAQVAVCLFRQSPTGQHVAPRVQVRGGLVPLRLAEHNNHGVGPDFFDELGTDSLHGSLLVGVTHARPR